MEAVKKFNNYTSFWLKKKRNDQETFRQIYNQHWSYLHTIAFNFTGNIELADDLVQDVFVDLWKNRERIDESRPVLPYLRSMIRFKVIGYLRHLSLSQQDSFIAGVRSELYREGISDETSEVIALNELDSWLGSSLEEIPERSRSIFMLSRYEDYTNQEIANKLNISIKTVEYHITKVIALLKPQIRQFTDVALAIIYGFLIF